MKNPVFYEDAEGRLYYKKDNTYIPLQIRQLGGGGGRRSSQSTSTPPNLFANALFVDAVFGNDTNAVPFSLMDNTNNSSSHKYATIQAATAAANAGDVIIVYPGDYTVNTSLYKNGVTYYFYADAIVSPSAINISIWSNSTPGTTCKVFGDGTFGQNVAFANTPILISAGTFYLEAHEIVNSDISMRVSGTADVTIKCHEIRSEGATPTFTPIVIIGNGTSLANGAKLFIECDIIDSGLCSSAIESAGNANENFAFAKIIVKDRIIYAGSGAAFFGAVYMAQASVTMEVYAHIYSTATLAKGIWVEGSNGTDPVGNTLKYVGNITSTGTGPTIFRATGQVGITIINFTGNVYSVGKCGEFNGDSDTKICISGSFVSTGDVGIDIVTTPEVKINGCINTDQETGIVKQVAGSRLVIGNLTIGTAGGTSMSAPAPDVVYVLHSLALQTAASNLTNALNPGGVANKSVMYDDPNVDCPCTSLGAVPPP